MKIKLLTASVAAVLLAGCGSDSDPVVKTYSVQAYDPAVINMNVVAICDGVRINAIEPTTNYKGMVGQARFQDLRVVASPSDCEFELTPPSEGSGVEAKDVSNGKVIKTAYKIPQGLAEEDGMVTGSPFSTLVAAKMEEAGVGYAPSIVKDVLVELGFDENTDLNGLDFDDFLRDTEAAIESFKVSDSTLATKFIATANVASDVIAANPDASPASIAVATKAITKDVIDANPTYPESATGEIVYVEIPAKDTQKVVEEVQDAIDNGEEPGAIEPNVPDIPPPVVGEPIDPVDPPTGTGGTGGN
ncbi:hypothetical protein [Vibrio campbellii]|uniref:hypothetical protein n=1 Tax=Vibrio campbellii TaxID=680 RepID=UPI0005EFA924|nr:hypothetical protein [Vibrio campbellii]